MGSGSGLGLGLCLGSGLWKGWRRKDRKPFFSGCVVFVADESFSFVGERFMAGSWIVRVVSVELGEPEAGLCVLAEPPPADAWPPVARPAALELPEELL
jgi:hypothetical protein